MQAASPGSAHSTVEFFAARYRGTGAPDVVALLEEIADRAEGTDGPCAGALIAVGGPDAGHVAARLVEAFAARDPSSPDLPGLRSLVALGADRDMYRRAVRHPPR